MPRCSQHHQAGRLLTPSRGSPLPGESSTPTPRRVHTQPPLLSAPLSPAALLCQRLVAGSPPVLFAELFPVTQHPSSSPPNRSSPLGGDPLPLLLPAPYIYDPPGPRSWLQHRARGELSIMPQPGPSPSVVSAPASAKSCSLQRSRLCL